MNIGAVSTQFAAAVSPRRSADRTAAAAPPKRGAVNASPTESAAGGKQADALELSAAAYQQLEEQQPAVESRSTSQTPSSDQLTAEEQQELEELKAVDREVRAHEAAHLSAAGGYARGGASFEYWQGPDGRRYAVGGEVQIDASAMKGDPKATIRKMQIVRAAALAPAKPSSQDRAVAAAATRQETRAAAELTRKNWQAGEPPRKFGESSKTPPQEGADADSRNKAVERGTLLDVQA